MCTIAPKLLDFCFGIYYKVNVYLKNEPIFQILKFLQTYFLLDKKLIFWRKYVILNSSFYIF